MAGEITRDGQSHACHTTLGSGVGGLSDLAVSRRDRCRVDDNATATILRYRVQRSHGDGRLRNHPERADQVDRENLGETAEIMRDQRAGFAVLAHGAAPGNNPGAIDQHAFNTMPGAHGCEGFGDRGIIRDIAPREGATQLRSDFGAPLDIQIKDPHLDSETGEMTGCRLAKTGSGSGNNRGD